MHTESMESNFKHACGLAVELVSETITSLKNETHKYEFDTEVNYSLNELSSLSEVILFSSLLEVILLSSLLEITLFSSLLEAS